MLRHLLVIHQRRQAYISLQKNASVYFQGNHASQGGGAIYVADIDTTQLSGFFDSGDFYHAFIVHIAMCLIFFDNTTDDGGNAIYGPFGRLSLRNYIQFSLL